MSEEKKRIFRVHRTLGQRAAAALRKRAHPTGPVDVKMVSNIFLAFTLPMFCVLLVGMFAIYRYYGAASPDTDLAVFWSITVVTVMLGGTAGILNVTRYFLQMRKEEREQF